MRLERIDSIFDFEKGTLQSTKCEPGDFDFITASRDWKSHATFTHEKEALVIAVAASGSLGRTHYVDGKFVASDLCFILTPKGEYSESISLPFYHFVFNGLKEDIVKQCATGTAKQAINQQNFSSYRIPYFEPDEQDRMALRLKAAFASQESLEHEITCQQSLLTKLKQAILQEAIQGKLTDDWRAAHPEVEPASQLLQRIQAEKARLIATKELRPEKPLPKITPAEIPFEIPKSWEWCPLAAVMILRDGERNPISKAEREKRGKGYPYYGASGVIDEIDGFTHDGDFLLVGEDGSNLRLRSTPVAFRASGKIWVNNHAHVLEFIEPVLQEFVAHRINGMDIAPFVTGGFQPKLSQENMNRIPIPLPPLAEQAAIVERVEALMTTCCALEAEIEHARTHAGQLLQAVLKEAFA